MGSRLLENAMHDFMYECTWNEKHIHEQRGVDGKILHKRLISSYHILYMCLVY